MSEPVSTFELATEWTGTRHTFAVEVWPTRAAMLEHLDEVHPDGNWHTTNEAGETAAGAFVNAAGFLSNEAPVALGTVYLNDEHLDIGTLVHELVHAGMFAYECDLVGNHSRARAHMTMLNETIAYLIGELMAGLAEQLLARGHYDRA